jgi:hypothetical protein
MDHFFVNGVDLSAYVKDIQITPAEAARLDAIDAGITKPFEATLTGTFHDMLCALCGSGFNLGPEGAAFLTHPALGRIGPVCHTCGTEWAGHS